MIDIIITLTAIVAMVLWAIERRRNDSLKAIIFDSLDTAMDQYEEACFYVDELSGQEAINRELVRQVNWADFEIGQLEYKLKCAEKARISNAIDEACKDIDTMLRS